MDDFFNWIDNAKLTHLAKVELCKLYFSLEKEKNISMFKLCEISNAQVAERIRDFCKIDNSFIQFDGKVFAKVEHTYVDVQKQKNSNEYHPVLYVENLKLTNQYEGLFPLKEKNKYYVVSHHLIKKLEKKISAEKVNEFMNQVYQSVMQMTPQMIPDADNMPMFINRMIDQLIDKNKVLEKDKDQNDDTWVSQLLQYKNKKPSITSVCKNYQVN